MAKIIWNKRAELLFAEHIEYARCEFGVSTALRWINQKNQIEARLRCHPESYPPEPIASNKQRVFRGIIVMKSFKLIYVYYPSSDIVRIVDIWDMRMNPKALAKRLE